MKRRFHVDFRIDQLIRNIARTANQSKGWYDAGILRN